MGKRAEGYGSEHHFLHYRRDRAADLDRQLVEALQAPSGNLEWVYPRNVPEEREPEGIAFLGDHADATKRWRTFWPRVGRAQTWDGVAKLHTGDATEWVLMEAKANTVEFVTPPCGAARVRQPELPEGIPPPPKTGRALIEASLNQVKKHLGVHRHYPWLGTYYQYANRLAVLHFLNKMVGIPARLLHVYFTGDCFPDGTECPATQVEWERLIEARRVTLGLPVRHPLLERCHEAFVPVRQD